MTSKSDPPRNPEATQNWGGTWPLFHESPAAFPVNSQKAVTPFRPEASDLDSLDARADLPETTPQAELETRQLTQSVPPPARVVLMRRPVSEPSTANVGREYVVDRFEPKLASALVPNSE